MGMPEITGDTVALNLTREDVRVLLQALNEVCNGFDLTDVEFTTRLGTSRAEALALIEALSLVGKSFRHDQREGAA